MMQKKQIRIVIDTNVWISFLIGKTLSGLTDALIDDKIKLLFSDELLDELVDVLQRPKFEKYFPSDTIRELIALIHVKAETVEIKEHFDACRDKKDNFLLDLCVSGKADYLITGDHDLLALNPFHSTEIIEYRSFQNILKN